MWAWWWAKVTQRRRNGGEGGGGDWRQGAVGRQGCLEELLHQTRRTKCVCVCDRESERAEAESRVFEWNALEWGGGAGRRTEEAASVKRKSFCIPAIHGCMCGGAVAGRRGWRAMWHAGGASGALRTGMLCIGLLAQSSTNRTCVLRSTVAPSLSSKAASQIVATLMSSINGSADKRAHRIAVGKRRESALGEPGRTRTITLWGERE